MKQNATVRLSQPDPFTMAHNAVMFDGKLSMAARLLWLAYRSHAWSGNTVFPGRKRLSEMVGCSLRTLDRANEELEEHGLIERNARWSSDGSQETNEVVVCVPSTTTGGDKNDTGGSKFDAPPVSNLAHKVNEREIDILDIQHISILEGLPRPNDDDDRAPNRQSLYRAFSTARHIMGERFPLSVLDKYKPELDFLVAGGYTPEQVGTATRNALLRYSSPGMVTFRSVTQHIDTLLEEQADKPTKLTKQERIKAADDAGYLRVRRLALLGDSDAFMVLSESDQLAIVAHVDWDTFSRLTEGWELETLSRYTEHWQDSHRETENLRQLI